MHKFEYTALRSIYEYFSSRDEKNLGTVRVLDYLPEHQAILVEASKDPNLRQLFMETSRLPAGFKSHKLELPFHNTGRWLRIYHEMAKEDNVQIRHANRHEYLQAAAKLTDYLGTAYGDKPFFQKIASALETTALSVLPDSLPLGLGHGDFAMRNILVGPNARITVIDTFAKWRPPIYEDLGYFLNGLKMSGPQVISQGLAFSTTQLSVYERAFLEGYFNPKPIPYFEIRLFEMLALLDKWSSVVTYSYKRKVRFKPFGETMSALTSRYYKICAKRLLREIDEAGNR
jgi:hypothetical protein